MRDVKDRVGTIGGSDAAAIFGKSPFSTAYEVALETLGRKEPTPSDDTMDLGTDLEEGIRRNAQRKIGYPIVTTEEWTEPTDPDHLFLVGHMDGFVVDQNAGVEIKKRSDSNWGEPGTDRVPPDVLIQCAFYMGLWEFPLRGFHVFNLRSLKTGLDHYWLPYNAAFVDAVIMRCVDFWNRIQAGWLPPPSSDAEARHMWAPEPGKTLVLDLEDERLDAFQRWRDARAARLEHEKAEKEAKLRVLEIIEDCESAWLGAHQLAAIGGKNRSLLAKKGLKQL